MVVVVVVVVVAVVVGDCSQLLVRSPDWPRFPPSFLISVSLGFASAFPISFSRAQFFQTSINDGRDIFLTLGVGKEHGTRT